MDLSNFDEGKIVGECLSMCNKQEALNSSHKFQEFEFDDRTNKFNPELAITSFRRSEANRNYKPDEVRPLPVLQKTMNHIMQYVIGKRLNTSEKTKEIDLYLYLRDRFRAMCQDITVQHLEGEEVIDLYQKMILFLIWAGARFPNTYGSNVFIVYQNDQLLTLIFEMLNYQYIRFCEKTKIHHQFEPEFRSFSLLLYISESIDQFLAQLKSIPEDLIETEPIQNVLKLRQAVISHNLHEFLKVINYTPIQFSVMALQNYPEFYYNTISATKKAFGSYKFNKDFFTTYLELPNKFFSDFTKCFLINQDKDNQVDDIYSFELNAQPNTKFAPPLPISLGIQRRFDSTPLLEFFRLKPSSPNISVPDIIESKNEIQEEFEKESEPEELVTAESSKTSTQPSAHISSQSSLLINEKNEKDLSSKSDFSEAENQSESEESSNENEMTSPKTSDFTEDENQPETEIINPIENQPSTRFSRVQSQKFEDISIPLFSMKMKKKFPKPILFDFKQMIPSKLPPYCFISILVNDSDDSPSAKFARDCLKSSKISNHPLSKKNYIIYLGDLKIPSTTCQKSHVYMSIVRKQLQNYMNSVGAILNCEDTTIYESEEGDDVQIFNFSLADSRCAPELTLNNLMRKCIEAAVVEFQPTNLTDIVKSALELAMKIALSPQWQKASCNSVMNLLNKVIDSLSDLFESELFMKFLLPFIHDEFGPKNMNQFAESIRKIKFSYIEKEESTQPRLDTTWPLFIRDNMKINSMTPFIAPVSIKFDCKTFLDIVLHPFANSIPNEYVIRNEDEEFSFTHILHSIDCDLCE